jgi:acyl dehydratase
MGDLYDDLKELIGKEGPPVNSVDEVCTQVIRHWCEAIEDDNPLYTDEEYARKSKYGRIIAPPTMVVAFHQAPLWPDGQEARWRHPEKLSRKEPLSPHEVAMEKLDEAGFTGMFATKVIQEFIRPLFPGDRVIRTTKLVSVTPEKRTSAGNGHFFSFVYSYTNQKGELVCEEIYTLFKFRPREEAPQRGGG